MKSSVLSINQRLFSLRAPNSLILSPSLAARPYLLGSLKHQVVLTTLTVKCSMTIPTAAKLQEVCVILASHQLKNQTFVANSTSKRY